MSKNSFLHFPTTLSRILSEFSRDALLYIFPNPYSSTTRPLSIVRTFGSQCRREDVLILATLETRIRLRDWTSALSTRKRWKSSAGLCPWREDAPGDAFACPIVGASLARSSVYTIRRSGYNAQFYTRQDWRPIYLRRSSSGERDEIRLEVSKPAPGARDAYMCVCMCQRGRRKIEEKKKSEKREGGGGGRELTMIR